MLLGDWHQFAYSTTLAILIALISTVLQEFGVLLLVQTIEEKVLLIVTIRFVCINLLLLYRLPDISSVHFLHKFVAAIFDLVHEGVVGVCHNHVDGLVHIVHALEGPLLGL